MGVSIRDTGISIVYEPGSGSPVVDIVIVHGLQGHPYKTWACKTAHRGVPSTAGSSIEAVADEDGSRKSYQRIVPRFSRKTSGSSSIEPRPNSSLKGYDMPEDGGDVKEAHVFWPKDLLPIQYPNARILVYGYDTRVTNYLSGPTNENSIHSHGKDLLASLAASRKLDCPLVLIAHSLGGIVVKEMLASSSNSTEYRLQNIVASTSAVIFLGTPHRGSHDLATLGDRARSMISLFRMRTNPAILDALRLKTKDLERAQEAFSAVWSRYNFRVKTFQEGLGLTGLNFGPFGKKVVPDFSSLLGDVRERAETIQANHMEMCRFTGLDDPNYVRICGELTSIYDGLPNAATLHHVVKPPSPVNPLAIPQIKSRAGGMGHREKTFLLSLSFPNMNQRSQNLESPAEGTCSWFFKHAAFVDWLDNKNQASYCGLLWLRGKPGSGKSTLLKEAFFRATMEINDSDCHIASFFFNAKGEDFEHSFTGMLRSVLHQMCSQNPTFLETLLDLAQSRRALFGEVVAPWEEAELKTFFRTAIIGYKQRIIIFVDALDECDSNSMRDVADFWRETTKTARSAGVQLSVCLSSRHFPNIAVNDCPSVIMEDHNHSDIIAFVRRRLHLGMTGRNEDQQAIQEKILKKSGGVFLWVSLVVKDVLRKRDEGRGMASLLRHLDSIPRELEDLFFQLLTAGPSSAMVLRMFQWAVLPTKPLRLHEWHHVLAVIGDTAPLSLHEWRQSDVYTETDEQLEKRITHLSRGLLGFSTRSCVDHEPDDESMSDRAGAGSLDLDTGETRVVQVIHESVRQYFIQGPGFTVLNAPFAESLLAHGHLSMMSVCLDYILIDELDALVEARIQAQGQTVGQLGPSQTGRSYNGKPESPTSLMPLDYFVSGERCMSPPPVILEKASEPCQSRRPSRPGSRASVASFGSAGSHYTRHSSPVVESQAHTRSPSVYDDLVFLPGPPEAYDIASWRSENPAVEDQACYEAPAAYASPSITGRSQVLEDYPALLSYATFELFTHARHADALDQDPRGIIQRLRHGLWSRWKALREDIDGETELLYFAADLGLSSWLKVDYIWQDSEVISATTFAIKIGNGEVFERLILAFPSVVYAKENISNILDSLGSAPDAALLQVYLSQHLAQNRAPTTMAMEDLLESSDEDGRTALHLAVIQQTKAGVLLLLKHGADVCAVDHKCRTPLHLACINSLRPSDRTSSDTSIGDDILAPRGDIIELLLDHHAPIDAVDAKGRTPLSMACSKGALPLLKDINENAANTRAQSERKCFSAVDILLQRGADATIRDSKGSLPLHRACYTGSDGRQSKLSVVSKLLDHGSPLDVVGNGGRTPLHFACYSPDVTIVKELLRRGANPTLQDDEGCSPLHIAAAFSTEQVVDVLVSLAGTSVNAINAIGSTPLHMACNFHSISYQTKPMKLQIIRRLLGLGAKAFTIRNRNGRSPFNIACDRDFEEALALLELLAEDSCDAPPRESLERNRPRAYSFPYLAIEPMAEGNRSAIPRELWERHRPRAFSFPYLDIELMAEEIRGAIPRESWGRHRPRAFSFQNHVEDIARAQFSYYTWLSR